MTSDSLVTPFLAALESIGAVLPSVVPAALSVMPAGLARHTGRDADARHSGPEGKQVGVLAWFRRGGGGKPADAQGAAPPPAGDGTSAKPATGPATTPATPTHAPATPSAPRPSAAPSARAQGGPVRPPPSSLRDLPWAPRPTFTSSTFRDLHAERDWLREHVFPELQERLRGRRVVLAPIDLRLGIDSAALAEEGARELQVLQVCLSEVERSRPFVIGLIGKRYCWFPPAEQMKAAADEAGFARASRSRPRLTPAGRGRRARVARMRNAAASTPSPLPIPRIAHRVCCETAPSELR